MREGDLMAMRNWAGPVFAAEWLTASRRWQGYALRSLLVLLPGAILVCLACEVFGCTLALTLSVWGLKTHEVLLATYAFGILWLLSAPIWAGLVSMLPGWARPSWLPSYVALLPYNPIFLVIAPIDGLPGMGPIGLGAQAWFCTLGLLTSALLAAAATGRIRAV